jgi:hypothetical protein
VSFRTRKSVSCYTANCISKKSAASIFKTEEYDTLNSWFPSALFYHTNTLSVFSLRIFFPTFYSYPPEPPSLPSSRNRTTANLFKAVQFYTFLPLFSSDWFYWRYSGSPTFPNISPPPPPNLPYHLTYFLFASSCFPNTNCTHLPL